MRPIVGFGAIQVAICGLVASAVHAERTSSVDGSALYNERCATCHEAGVPRAANRASLARISAENLRLAVTSGVMAQQAAGLSTEQREALVQFLATSVSASHVDTDITEARCPAGDRAFAPSLKQPHWSGWGADLAHRRFQPAAMAQLPAAEVPKLELKWAFGFEGAARAFAQPAVIGGRVFVGSANRKVYSLSAATGCTHWTFAAENPVRTAITIAPLAKGWVAYFSDLKATTYALDAESGELLWKTRVDDHDGAMTTGAPALSGNVLYVPASSTEEAVGAGPKYECCKFRGSVSALDASTGKVLWKSYTITDELKPTRKNVQGTQLFGPAGAGVWASPTVDTKHKRIYVTTGDDYTDPASDASDAFIAFDAMTGKRLWTRQMTAGDTYNIACDLPEPFKANCPQKAGPDHDFGSSAILVELSKGKRALIAGQKSGHVHAIDPDRDGAILWQQKLSAGGKSGGIQWGSAADAEHVYVAVSDVAQKPAQPGAPGGQPTFFGIPMVLDSEAGGGLYALKLATGETAWHTPHPGCNKKPGCSPAQSAAVTAIPGAVFSGGLDGHLRAYDAKTGAIIWDVDTVQEYQTVNGVKANGGALDGPGPVVVDGMVYVNSGYLYVGSMPGNVLLAYSVNGK
jgi:polyvinyl alcohol dehydrogenase (cytochrome)